MVNWCLDARWREGNRVLALSLASRWEPYGWIGPEGRYDERNDVEGLESTPHSKFHEPPKIESIRRITEPIRFHPVFKNNVQNARRIDSPSSESILRDGT
ncbi:hypothetical protein PIB30_032935 [Stylosanthes scabra]|uniref:Ycf15 n=1 Tax=Stylosanthes scabra TaxID=79078 RepID=A0ABU6XB76_9FABA|nr:hypothetical protein [Stylosanthes scabra]